MPRDAISDQEIVDDHVEQTGDQARRVGVAANGPIQVDGSYMGDEPSHPDQRQDDPVSAKTVKEQIAHRDRSYGSRVKPKEHPPGIARPEVISDPLHKATVDQCLVKEMNDVRCEKCPEEQT